MNSIPKRKTGYFLLVMVMVTTLTYLNHFDNSFHFDDFHTITENPHIRSLKNIPSFFSDGTTFSSIPQNQSYRPIVTTSLTIDYWLSDGFDPFYYHLSSFILFLFQGFLIFLFVYKILENSHKTVYNFYISCGITLWYMLHPVMAETINYVISRSDLQSTFFIVLAFVLYQYSLKTRKYYLYLLPIIIGTMAKPPAIMFAPLFFCYLLVIEKKINLFELFSKAALPEIKKTAVQTLPAAIVCVLLYFFIKHMMPSTFVPGGTSVFNYIITQPFVLLYYFGNVFFPIHLSADTDWVVLESIWSLKFFIGITFVIGLIAIAFVTSKKPKFLPISFGIIWFFLALIPTSSIIPLAEVMNDHRMFFPFVGLILSTGWAIALAVLKLKEITPLNNQYIAITCSIFLLMYAYGTYARNEVWQSEETLWKDVTIKSPNNGRGQMNYGLTLMAKGQYDQAEQHFIKALESTPYYHTLHINLGILNNAQGDKDSAQNYFKKAIQHGANYYSPWYYYGEFLTKISKNQEAVEKLSKALQISPSHINTRLLLMQNYQELAQWELLNQLATSSLEIDPENIRIRHYLEASILKVNELEEEEKAIDKTPNALKYINLSIKYHQKEQYDRAIAIAQKAIKISPDFYEAYNNICASYTQLELYDKAIENCKKALELKPDFTLAKNNLNDAISRKENIKKQLTFTKNNPTAENYLSLSLQYYNQQNYLECINIAKEGLNKFPNSDNLYNNICAAYNSLKEWNKAAEAGKKGLEINPNNQLLKNNYNWALKNQ